MFVDENELLFLGGAIVAVSRVLFGMPVEVVPTDRKIIHSFGKKGLPESQPALPSLPLSGIPGSTQRINPTPGFRTNSPLKQK